ncbi:hypothetical protein SAMN05216357_11311 [Porphyromonadaceae bacterium KH3CP3RA]|nr:hypothetical protein SAMN05216357_11311 [Porphyromonadaceae bacterium KH3CP3RA]
MPYCPLDIVLIVKMRPYFGDGLLIIDGNEIYHKDRHQAAMSSLNNSLRYLL